MSKVDFIYSKIKSLPEAIREVEAWKLRNDKIVFTNGCFDILHKGHILYLAKAAEKGNRMIVGINSDASVKRQGKGEERPINDELARELVIASLGFVDLVILFQEDTPFELIKHLQPDLLIKGADYDPSEENQSSKKYIIGSDIVRSYGGKVEVIDLEAGYSTTSIVVKLKG
jgi:rfaE bifunctional protein nucleotidyltransferase chain/domain